MSTPPSGTGWRKRCEVAFSLEHGLNKLGELVPSEPGTNVFKYLVAGDLGYAESLAIVLLELFNCLRRSRHLG